jgi:argininosuccinate lyase
MFRAIDLTIESVDIMAFMMSKIRFRPENIELSRDIYATEEAYELVTSDGVPFREAYRQVAKRYANPGSRENS